MIEQPHADVDRASPEGIVDGDAATHLEALISGVIAPAPHTMGAEGLPIELVAEHLRLSGTVLIGRHRRLTDFVNNHTGLIELHDVTVLHLNGDPTQITSPSIWVNPEEVTLVGETSDVGRRETAAMEFQPKRTFPVVVVTAGHTLTGELHLIPEATLAAFMESSSPVWIPMTDVSTRSLADRRVVSRYGFALVNRRQIVAATELQPGMERGRDLL